MRGAGVNRSLFAQMFCCQPKSELVIGQRPPPRSPFTFHLSPFTFHLSPFTFHPSTRLKLAQGRPLTPPLSLMKLLDLILGRPLASSEDQQERVGPNAGVSVFGLDALSSAGYRPGPALTVLIPLGVACLGFGLPITLAVSALFPIFYFIYPQTIPAY